MDISKFRNYTFLIGIITISSLLLFILKPFFYPVFWAAVFASLFYPINKRISSVLKSNAGAFLTLVLITIIVLLPLSLIAAVLFKELFGIYNYLNSHHDQIGSILQSLNQFFHSIPYLSGIKINDTVITQQINDLSGNFIGYFYEVIKSLTQNSLEFFVLFVLMLYSMFFFLRDGDRMLQKIMYYLPLGKKYENLLFAKFLSTAGSTIKSTLLVGSIQGILGGLLFFITGVPSPIIWGIIMGVLGSIPVTGTFIVWLPAGVFMILSGHLWQGIVILSVGAALVSTIDNMLRPMFVGRDIQMHPVLVLFSTLGGILAFGLTGFILGPLIAALCQTLWNLYGEYYHTELSKN